MASALRFWKWASRALLVSAVGSGLFFVVWAFTTERERRDAVREVHETRAAMDSTRESLATQALLLSAIRAHIDSVETELVEHHGAAAPAIAAMRNVREDVVGIRRDNAAIFTQLRRIDSMLAARSDSCVR